MEQQESFKLLSPALQSIVEKRFEKPTLIQQLVIPRILKGENVLAIAPVGTGKTESAMFGIFDMWLKSQPKPISILYITPLRSLNRDLLDRLLWWGQEIGMEITVRHGDTGQHERRLQTLFPNDMFITTPETLQAILPGKVIKEHLKNVKFVVIDEVHELVDSKRGTQLSLAIERLRELTGEDFQIIGLSATVGSPEHVAKFISPNKDIEIVKAVTSKEMEIKVVSATYEPEDKKIVNKLNTSPETAARLRLMMDLIKNSRSVLAFTNTREFAEVLANRIRTIDRKFPSLIHHSSLSKEVRISAEKQFKEEKVKAIISTSSLQLGIDIGSIDLVLQYMSPRQVSQLVQRVGRSGHEFHRTSKGIIISTDEDDIFESAVIARKALNEELEPLVFHQNSYDVLAHQIVGLTMDQWKIDVNKVYEIVKRAYPYRNLSFPEFLEVCKQLQQIGLIFLDQNITKRRRGFEYYFENLSTIPTMKQFKVVNMLDHTFVGVLDEEFVALHGAPNTTFVLKGESYRIVQVEEDKVMVEPTVDIEAAIPGWEGELIPVPFEVSQEVGRLRAIIQQKLKEKDERKVAEDVVYMYPVDESTAKKMVKVVKSQLKYGIVPDDRTILIEDFENTVIIHSCFGTVVNETLGRFLTALLTTRIGSVGLKVDPYRIILQFQQKNMEILKEIIFKTNPFLLKDYVEMSLARSSLFEWKFVHVAKRFGVLSRDAEYGRVRLGRIIDTYVGTPVFKETLRELETEKLDLEKAAEVLKRIQKNEIALIFKSGLSPIGKIGLRQKFAEIVGPNRPEVEIFDLFKQRLFNTKIRLACLNCGQYDQTFVLKELKEETRCRKCSAKLLAVVHPRNSEILKIIKKKIRNRELTTDENKRYEVARKTGDLFLVYGKKAAVALAAKGVGPMTARRILAQYHKSDEQLLRDLLEAERNFIKTRKFWAV